MYWDHYKGQTTTIAVNAVPKLANTDDDKKRYNYIQKTIKKTCIIGTNERRKIIQRLGTFTNWKAVSNACT